MGAADGNLLEVIDDDGRNVFDDYFSVDGDALHLTQTVMLALMTLDTRIVRQDCLCYLMRRLAI